MSDNKRTQEASSLRAFFDEQMSHLHSLVDSVSSYLDEMEQAEEDQQIIEGFVEIANNKMRAVQGYADKLRQYVRPLYSHVLQIADEIPPPINLNADSFKTNALVNALFVNTEDIERLFATNPDVNAFWHKYHKEDVSALYAVLTAHKNEKPTLGVGMQGDILVRDVLKHEVNFYSHKIYTPCPSHTELNTALKTYLFNRVVTLIRQEINAQMNQAQSLRSYEARVNSLANPDVYLNTLIQYIENPANLLSLEKTHFKLSKLGVKLNDDDQQNANEFDIHELIWRDSIRMVVLQISYTGS